MLCRSPDHIRRNDTRAERGDYTWNAKLFCDLHVDSICSLLVSLNEIKRTHLLAEYNNSHRGTQFLEVFFFITSSSVDCLNKEFN